MSYNRGVITLALVILGTITQSQAGFMDGLVAYYPFNGNANDGSGSGNNGTVYGSALATDRFGNPNSAYSFNGLTDYIGIPDSPSLNPTSFISVSAWIKPNKITTIKESFGIVSKFGADNSMVGQWVLWQGNVDKGSGPQPGFRGYVVGTGQSRGGDAFFATPQADGRWHHLMMTYDGALVLLYEDGNVVSSSPLVGNIEVFAQAVEIGRWFHGLNNGGNNYYFSGLIDDIRIYNRGLAASEVRDLYDSESVQPSTGPIITQQPTSQTANAGANVTFSVGLKTAGTYNYQWQLNEQNLPAANQATLTLNNLAAGTYRYRVIVSNTAGTVISDTATLTVNPNPPPTISTQPRSQSVQEDSNVVLSVSASGLGGLIYQWQLNQQNIQGANQSTLNLNAVKVGSSGRYRVLVSSPYGVTISEEVVVTVQANPPPSIVTQPKPQSVQEDSNVVLSVIASGLGGLIYQWQLNQQNIQGANQSTLNLNAVRVSSSGRYRVLVSSPYGVTISEEVVVTVQANPPPTILTQPISQAPPEGSQIVLTVVASGPGILSYQWQLDQQNIPAANQATLVFTGIRPASNGKYRVFVSTQYGVTTSSEAIIRVVVTDSDGDGLSDFEELLQGTDPNKSDTDGDGLADELEIRKYHTDPLKGDTDGDGYSDGIEVALDGNPTNASIAPTGALALFRAVDVEFHTLTGVKYQLENSSDMVNWNPQGPVVTGNGARQNHLVRAAQASSFWRLRVVP